ncbi:hypothetical protein JCM10908_001914 [Rhodotorula pacifica]|uniref:uncharacterized protein n=1 Tax=Rhodotorula pacifica TaxID=1495444 RepID=UPI003181D2C7
MSASALLRSALPRRALAVAGPTSQRRLASGGVHYNEPTGRLFGEQPLAPGQKRSKEDWENIYYYGFGGSMLLGAVLIYYKPDTSIEGWARQQAKEKLAAAGETPSYQKSSE